MALKRQTISKPMVSVGAHTQNSTLSSAVTLTPPATATVLMIQPIGNNVRFTIDGTVPTASKGFRLATGTVHTISIAGNTVVKVIEETASASVEYQWLG